MKLRTKFSLCIVGLLVMIVFLVSAFNINSTTRSMLAQTEQDGKAISQVLARSSSFAERVPGQVENILGEQMVVEARITANMIAIAAGKAGMSSQEIETILKNIIDNTVLNEFWITDHTGRVEFTSTGIDFTFESDSTKQPQAYIFYQLLGQQNGKVMQQAEKRELDAALFKYVGVSGIDKPRIVQVGYQASILSELSKDINIQKLVDELTGQANVAAIRIMNNQQGDIASSAHPIDGIGASLSGEDIELIGKALAAKEVSSALQENVLRVATPVLDGNGNVLEVVLVYLTTETVQAAIRESFVRTILIAIAVIIAGAIVSLLFSNGVTRHIRKLTAAAQAMETGAITEEEIIRLSRNHGKDEVASLSRVFAKMAAEVKARENRLKKQVEELKIEIDHTKKARQVAEITETDYFQNLKQKAKEMRDKKAME